MEKASLRRDPARATASAAPAIRSLSYTLRAVATLAAARTASDRTPRSASQVSKLPGTAPVADRADHSCASVLELPARTSRQASEKRSRHSSVPT